MDDQHNPQEEAKQMQDLIVQDLKELRDAQKKAKKQLETVQQLVAEFDVLKEKLTNPQGGIEANIAVSKEGNEKVQAIKITSEQLLATIQANSQQIDSYVSQANSQLEKISTLLKQGEAESSSIKQILTDVTASKEQIESIKKSSTTNSTAIDESYQKVLKSLEDVTQAYQNFIGIKAKIDDPANGLEAALTLANKLKDEVSQARATAEDSLRQTKKLETEIGATKVHTDKTSKEIEENKKKSEEFKNQIGEVLKLVTDGSLADGFDTRKKELEKDVKVWSIGHWLCWGGLIVTITVIYWSQYWPGSPHINDWQFWYRFAFTSPFIYALFVTSRQFGKARDLLEKYAFKLTTSLSLQNYIKLLDDSFPEKEYRDKLLGFALNSIDMIYKEPYIEKDRNRKYNIGFNRFFNIDIEEKEFAEQLIKNPVLKQIFDQFKDILVDQQKAKK